MIRFFFILGFILSIGCKQKPSTVETQSNVDSLKDSKTETSDSTYKSYYSLSDIRTNTSINTNLCYIVDTLCAVAILPDTLWINEQQRSMSEDDWNTIVDDHQYYQSLAEDTLETNGIKVFYRLNDRRFIKFVKNNGQVFTIDKQKKKDMWGLILFNGIDDPVIWGDMEINTALREIYKK